MLRMLCSPGLTAGCLMARTPWVRSGRCLSTTSGTSAWQFAKDPIFLQAAEGVAAGMNAWAEGFFGRKIIEDWRRQLDFTTRIFRARGLHLDDRHIRNADGSGFSASMVDAALYVVANHESLAQQGASLVLYLPKIQTAEEAALWHDILSGVETCLGLSSGAVKDIRSDRAARGLVPVDGDFVRPWETALSDSIPAAGITSTALRMPWPGIGISSIRTSMRSS